MTKAGYASKGIAGTVDKATELIDTKNSKVADTEVLAKFSEDADGLKYDGQKIEADQYIEDSSTDFDVTNKKLSLSNALSTKLTHIDESDAYDETKADYVQGQSVIYNNEVYKAKLATTPAGSIGNTTYWEKTSMGKEFSVLNNKLDANTIKPDYRNIIHQFSAGENWTATEDCILAGYLSYEQSQGANSTNVYILYETSEGQKRIVLGTAYFAGTGVTGGRIYSTLNCIVKKGDVVQTGTYGGYAALKAYKLH